MTFKALKIVDLLGVSGIAGWVDGIPINHKLNYTSDSSARNIYKGYLENTEEQGEGHRGIPGVRDAWDGL